MEGRIGRRSKKGRENGGDRRGEGTEYYRRIGTGSMKGRRKMRSSLGFRKGTDIKEF